MPPRPKKKEEAPKGPDIGSREERKKLVDRLTKSKSSVKGFKEYAEKMKKLDTLMDKYSVPNLFGAAKTMDAKAKKEMQKAMQETAMAGEEYLKNAAEAGRDLSKGIPSTVNSLQGLLNRDTEAMERYDPQVPRSLPQVLEEGRSSILLLGDKEMKKVGGAQNSRIPMVFRDRKGKEHRGLFTKATHAQSMDEYVNDLTKKASNQLSGPSRDLIANMIPNYRERNKERLGKCTDAQVFQEIWTKCFSRQKNGLKPKGLEEVLDIPSYEKLGRLGLTNLQTAFRDFDQTGNKNVGRYLNSSIVGMKDGARIDNRNSAMSAVAKLLDQPDLIAKSVNMQFVDKNGDTVEGTFMDYADGVDLAGENEPFRMVNDDPLNGPGSGKALKKLADLQVLDYLCGNVDRHPGNMFYKLDKNGDLYDVKGIDNDSSFGRFAHANGEKHALVGANDLGVISASMSKKIKSMTPEMLKFTLRGRGLSEDEIEFSAQRLTTLQTAIRDGETYYKTYAPKKGAYVQGHLRTVPDKELQKMKADQLCVGNSVNIFNHTTAKINDWVSGMRNAGYAFDPKAQEKAQGKEKALPQVETAGRGFSGGSLARSLSGASRLVADPEKKFKVGDLTSRFRGSPQFDELVAAAKKVAALEKDLQDRPDMVMGAYNLRRREIEAAVRELKEKNQAYQAKKLSEKGVESMDELRGKNDFERDRIAYSRKVEEFVNAFRAPREMKENDLDAMTEQDRMEFHVADELERMQDAQDAYKMLQEIHKKHGLPAPEQKRILPEKGGDPQKAPEQEEQEKEAGDGNILAGP